MQQRSNEEEHLQILLTIAKHDTVDFKQKLLQDRQALGKALLQEVKRVEGRIRGGWIWKGSGEGGEEWPRSQPRRFFQLHEGKCNRTGAGRERG